MSSGIQQQVARLACINVEYDNGAQRYVTIDTHIKSLSLSNHNKLVLTLYNGTIRILNLQPLLDLIAWQDYTLSQALLLYAINNATEIPLNKQHLKEIYSSMPRQLQNIIMMYQKCVIDKMWPPLPNSTTEGPWSPSVQFLSLGALSLSLLSTPYFLKTDSNHPSS